MELIRDPLSIRRKFPGCALSVGNFDGVHLGHQNIIAEAVTAAGRDGAVVFTFEPHPLAILRPGDAPPRILSFERKLAILASLGVRAVVCPLHPRSVLDLEPRDFVRRVVVEGLAASVVVEGRRFNFGRRGAGNLGLLRELGGRWGFEVREVPAVEVGGERVSSTRIRRLVAAGDVAQAAALLGRPFEFEGRVIHGRGRGHRLGYPTVNLSVGDYLVPAEGVYAGTAHWDGRQATAAISVGRCETFHPLACPAVEAFLLEVDEDLYGRRMDLRFVDRLRGQRAFADAGELTAQMSRDCEAARRLVGR